MRVQKIILANPEVFNIDPLSIDSEIAAIRKIASMTVKGDPLQVLNFNIRQTYTAIYNLIAIGFHSLAIDLAIDLIPTAEKAHSYKIAQDLCGLLINHYYQSEDPSSVRTYKMLYDKISLIVANEHDTMVLYGQVTNNYTIVSTQNKEEVNMLLKNIEKKLPNDRLNNHYYFYLFKSFLLEGRELEQLYMDAISYFKGLYFQHHFFIDLFTGKLIQYYLKHKDLDKAEAELKLIERGSISWFKKYLLYAKALLKNRDIYSNDVCLMAMEHPNYIGLPYDLKEAWKGVYKATIRLLLER